MIQESFLMEDEPKYDVFEFITYALLLIICLLILLRLLMSLLPYLVILNWNLFLILLNTHFKDRWILAYDYRFWLRRH